VLQLSVIVERLNAGLMKRIFAKTDIIAVAIAVVKSPQSSFLLVVFLGLTVLLFTIGFQFRGSRVSLVYVTVLASLMLLRDFVASVICAVLQQ